jgi:hypothetical protein
MYSDELVWALWAGCCEGSPVGGQLLIGSTCILMSWFGPCGQAAGCEGSPVGGQLLIDSTCILMSWFGPCGQAAGCEGSPVGGQLLIVPVPVF